MTGFRYVLEFPNREPADPAMFISALPPGMWKTGDMFLAGSDLREFRILAIDSEAPGVLAGHVHGIWIVEPTE